MTIFALLKLLGYLGNCGAVELCKRCLCFGMLSLQMHEAN